MKQVFRLKTNPDVYQTIFAADNQDAKRLNMECTRRAENWVPPEVYMPYPFMKQADFMGNNGIGSIIVTSKAAAALEDFFSISSELLPLPCEDKTYHIVNVLNCVNCLDTAKTKWRSRSEIKIPPPLEYVFFADRLWEPIGLLKIPETHKLEILVWIDTEADPIDNFIHRVEYHGLTGLDFEKLWEG